MINEGDIARIYNDRRAEIEGENYPDSEFGPEVFADRTITGTRKIDTNGENPRFLNVLDFSDGSSLAIGHERDEMSPLYHFLLISPDLSDKYAEASHLLDGDYEG